MIIALQNMHSLCSNLSRYNSNNNYNYNNGVLVALGGWKSSILAINLDILRDRIKEDPQHKCLVGKIKGRLAA